MEGQINELVELKQLPVILYQLEEIGKIIDTQLEGIAEMECTEENKTEVKKRRTEINNLTTSMENKRKEIKKKILADYEVFNEKYEKEIKTKLLTASDTLKEKISVIEKEQLDGKKETLKRFFNEYAINLRLTHVICFDDLKLNITLSASEKSLKEAIKGKLESVANDISLINLEEYKEEILFAYKYNGYNFANAKLEVLNRHKQMEEMSKIQEKNEEQKEEENKIEEVVEEIIAPVEIEQDEIPTPEIDENQMMMYTFTVTGTKEQIVMVRDFMKANGISYE